jgi:hypothetical protein
LHNSKSIAVQGVRIIDHFPVSEDSKIQVKHVNPSLNLTDGLTDDLKKQLTVAKGVVAQWQDADEADTDTKSLGKNGKFNWICSISAQSKVNLTLQWEVIVPKEKTGVIGIDG